MSAEETSIQLKYQHALSTNDLRETRKQNVARLTQIKTCVTNIKCKLHVLGLSNGKIIYWRPNITAADDSSNDDKLVCYEFEGHQNASVYSLCYGMCDIMDTKKNKYGLIVSGGVDSKIKIYDPWHRQDKAKICPVLQLNNYHNGTILCLNYLNNQLISASTDCTIRVWSVKKHTNPTQATYPQIQCKQTIKFNSWCRCVCQSINNKYLMIANDKGILYTYSKTSSRAPNSPLYNMEYYCKLHSLSITFMLFVANTNYIITLSSDYTMQVYDSISCSAIFAVKNPQNCKYISADYNGNNHELYVVDELGYIYIWDIQHEQCLYTKQLRKSALLWLQCLSSTQIAVTAADCVEIYNIKRMKRLKVARGHEADVIGVLIVDDAADTDMDKVMYSVGIDNSILEWDIESMSCKGIFYKQSDILSYNEISTLIHIQGTCLLVSGHHDGRLYCWNTQNASNTKLPHAHSDAVTGIHYNAKHAHNNRQIIFSIGQDGVLAVYDLETKKNEKIFKWQKSIVLNEKHGMLSIVSSAKYCYIGSSAGDIYEYDIEMCVISKTWNVCNNMNIIDLQIDSNFLFIGCECGDILIWELELAFEIDRYRINNHSASKQKCVGIYFDSNSHLLIIIYETRIIVYDYVLGIVKKTVHFQQYIASFTFYNDYIFCGCKNATISKTKLISFNDANEKLNESMTGIVNVKQKRWSTVSKKRAFEEIQPIIDWNKGDREFRVNFNKSFGN